MQVQLERSDLPHPPSEPSLVENLRDMLVAAIEAYLNKIQHPQGLKSDQEFFLEHSIEVLQAGTFTAKKFRMLAQQIQGQFQINSEVLNEWQEDCEEGGQYNPDYIRFRRNPPVQILSVCELIIETVVLPPRQKS